MVDWSGILSSKSSVNTMKSFATGEMSGRTLYSQFANTDSGGAVRQLLRQHGVTYGRRLARKALTRRGY